MITLMKMPIRHGSAPLRVARGHFATNHSHINYYVDITYQKTRLSEAKDSARQLVANFVNDTPVDTMPMRPSIFWSRSTTPTPRLFSGTIPRV